MNGSEQQSRAHSLAGSEKSACYARVTGFQPTPGINFHSSLRRYNTHGITSLSFSIHLPDWGTLTSTWPPLDGGDSGAVEDELLRGGVVSGCSFQAPKMSPWKQENTLFWQEVGHKTETRTELDNGKWNSSSNVLILALLLGYIYKKLNINTLRKNK